MAGSHKDMRDLNPTWENMRAGIEAQVALVRDMTHPIYRQVKEKLQDVPVPSRVYLLGCGDSWASGLATRLAFERWAGVPTEALPAMEFSRYLIDYAPPQSLVVATSNYGRTSRTIECVIQARACDLKTVAVTANPESPIAREADFVLDLTYSERSFAPGTSSYIASLLILYSLALFLGEREGRLVTSEVESILKQIADLASPMQQTLEAAETPVKQLVQRVQSDSGICFLGAGPNYGTARFSASKMFEANRQQAISQELEEWAHEGFFFTDPNTYTFVLAAQGAGLDRAREQLSAIKAVDSYGVALCEVQDSETQALADLTFPVFGRPDEILSPLLYCLSAELFALQFAITNNITLLGFDDERWVRVNFPQIYASRIKS